MKFVILLFLLVLCLGLYANPMAPKLFSELYLGEGSNWWLELSPIGIYLVPGDSIRITNQSSEIQFEVTQTLDWGQCLVINSTQYPLTINHQGATLSVSVYSSQTSQWYDYFDNFEFASGYPNNCLLGQSLVYNMKSEWENTYFILTVEASPTPGTHPFDVTTFGVLSGFVRDFNLVPVANARITHSSFDPSSDVYTDINGYYIATGLEGQIHHFEVYVQNTSYESLNIPITPNQTLNHDFRLINYVPNHDPEQNHSIPVIISANPIHAGDDIKFAKIDHELNSVVLKIYNLKGEVVFRQNTSSHTGEITYNIPNRLASGVYIYHLESGHKTLKKDKLTIIE